MLAHEEIQRNDWVIPEHFGFGQGVQAHLFLRLRRGFGLAQQPVVAIARIARQVLRARRAQDIREGPGVVIVAAPGESHDLPVIAIFAGGEKILPLPLFEFDLNPQCLLPHVRNSQDDRFVEVAGIV